MIESLLILAALGAMGAAAWFAYRAAGVDPIRAERDRLRTEMETVRRENTQLAADLAAAKATTGARSESEEARFVAIAAKALEASQAQFMALANETFEKHKVAAQGSVKEVLTPAQEALAKLATSVDALEKARLADKSALSEQMRAIGDAMRDTQGITSKLVMALRAAPKTRGRWGEETLKNVLELSGLSQHADFVEQGTHRDDEGKMLRPDVIIRLPGGRSIIVDAKVAISGYLDAIDAPDEASREAHLKKHAAELRQHVKALSQKDYSKNVDGTADFVALFIPGENFFAAAVERDPTLFEDAMKSRVVIVTPVTLMALARSIAYGWRQEESAKNAQEIADLGRELFRRMAVMVDKMIKVGESIERSSKTYNEMVGSVEARVLPQVRKFKELGAGDAGIDVAAPQPLETAVRQLPPPEQLELMPPTIAPQAAKRGR